MAIPRDLTSEAVRLEVEADRLLATAKLKHREHDLAQRMHQSALGTERQNDFSDSLAMLEAERAANAAAEAEQEASQLQSQAAVLRTEAATAEADNARAAAEAADLRRAAHDAELEGSPEATQLNQAADDKDNQAAGL